MTKAMLLVFFFNKPKKYLHWMMVQLKSLNCKQNIIFVDSCYWHQLFVDLPRLFSHF